MGEDQAGDRPPSLEPDLNQERARFRLGLTQLGNLGIRSGDTRISAQFFPDFSLVAWESERVSTERQEREAKHELFIHYPEGDPQKNEHYRLYADGRIYEVPQEGMVKELGEGREITDPHTLVRLNGMIKKAVAAAKEERDSSGPSSA